MVVTRPLRSGLNLSMGNRLPTGPGSRGGQWHDPEFRKAYYRAWRYAHPEYRDRERLRRARERAIARSEDPAGIVVPPTTTRPLPDSAQSCTCRCGCAEPTTFPDFRTWIKDSMAQLGLSQGALGRMVGRNHRAIGKTINGEWHDIGLDRANAIYRALIAAGASALRCGFCRGNHHAGPLPRTTHVGRHRYRDLVNYPHPDTGEAASYYGCSKCGKPK